MHEELPGEDESSDDIIPLTQNINRISGLFFGIFSILGPPKQKIVRSSLYIYLDVNTKEEHSSENCSQWSSLETSQVMVCEHILENC